MTKTPEILRSVKRFDYSTAEGRKVRRQELAAARAAAAADVVETETEYRGFVIRHTTDPFVSEPVEIERDGLVYTDTFATVDAARIFIDGRFK